MFMILVEMKITQKSSQSEFFQEFFLIYVSSSRGYLQHRTSPLNVPYLDQIRKHLFLPFIYLYTVQIGIHEIVKEFLQQRQHFI